MDHRSAEAAGIVGILLAAGIGRRFDPSGARLKLLEPARAGFHAGEPIAIAAARSLKSAVAHVIAVVRPAHTEQHQRLHTLLSSEGIELVVNARADDGMGTSIACGVAHTRSAAGWLIALADMPAIDSRTISAVREAIAGGAATAAPFVGKRRGHPVGFARALAAQLCALEGDEGARLILQNYPPQRLAVDDAGALLDIDLPGD